MRPNEIVSRLEAVQPCRLQAVEVILALDEAFRAPTLNTDDLTGHQGEMDAAMRELDEHAKNVRKAIERCAELRPIPSKAIPPGF